MEATGKSIGRPRLKGSNNEQSVLGRGENSATSSKPNVSLESRLNPGFGEVGLRPELDHCSFVPPVSVIQELSQ